MDPKRNHQYPEQELSKPLYFSTLNEINDRKIDLEYNDITYVINEVCTLEMKP